MLIAKFSIFHRGDVSAYLDCHRGNVNKFCYWFPQATTWAMLIIIFDSHGGEPLEAMNLLEAL